MPVKLMVLEAALVAAFGVSFALLANALSPRGLELSRNYFPPPTAGRTNFPTATNLVPAVTGTNAASAVEIITARLRQRGLQPADRNQVAGLFRDPRYEQNRIVFVDARDDGHYQAGHVPRAYQLDYYRPAAYLPTVVPACQMAEQIVVYCDGGTCEDSEFTAVLLLSANIPADKLWVYVGGFSEWSTNALPVELGQRGSGQIRNSTP